MTRARRLDARRIRAAAFASLLLVGLAAGHRSAQAQSLPSTSTRAVATYEAVGLYWANPGGTAGCEVRYRRTGASAWSQGLAMWYDSRDSECRGSLVHLAPGTDYQVELNLPGQAATRALTFRTWANQRPVARTVTVNSGSGTLNIIEGGSAAGYVVYQGAAGASLDAQNNAQYNVSVNASYVIVRGLNLRGARQDAIRISPNVKDVVIEDNDISGWGRQRSGIWGVDMDSAIRAVCSQPTLERVTIQRNRIHDPRYSANSWSDGHPAGPQAITISYCGGNHVIRHNEMYSTTGRYFNDAIGGEDNFTKSGFPNADTDIYGNLISHAWDDGIEAEGANENVRIWGNYIDRTAIGIATTVISVGPAYIFRNVWNRSQFFERGGLDGDDRQPFFKSGSDESLGNGRRYVFHNTMLQATQAGLANGLGGGFGMGGTGASQLINNTFSKNNIYQLWKPGKSAFYQTGLGNEIANDLYNGTMGDATIVNGIYGTPIYALGHGWVNEAGGQYQLASNSPGYDRGVRIANFNDAFSGAAPDVGAHEANSETMRFGIPASAGSSVSASTTTSPQPSAYALTVAKGGNGFGTVTSSPAGISCGTTCSSSLAVGTAVSLSAAPASGSTFAGWSGGGCSGVGMCTVTATAALAVTASFTASTPFGGVTPSAASLDFSGSAPRTQTVTYTNNTGSRITFIQASMSSARFGQSNDCNEVDSGASCTSTVTYYPTNSGSDSGTLTMTSTAPNSPHVTSLQAASPSSRVAETDFNDDGRSDLLWRNTVTGQVYRMLMNGFASIGGTLVYAEPNLAWKIVGDADFNGDGVSDLLWHNVTTGEVSALFFNASGLPVAASPIHVEPDTAWKIVQTPDLNGDGKADIVWWNSSTGEVYAMLMNGSSIAYQGLVYREPDTAWRIAAAGDFAGSGKRNQLLWRNNSTGQVYLMTVNVSATGFTQSGLQIYVEGDTGWKILGAADFNGDGMSDILWRNELTGQVFAMLMNGPAIIAAAQIYREGNLAWKIVAQGDYDGDGRADLLWRNDSTGQVYLVRMNGLAIEAAAAIYQETDTAWNLLGSSIYRAS